MTSSTRTSPNQPDRRFTVDVAALRRRPGSRRDLHLEGPIAEMFVTSSRIEDDATVAIDGVLESVHGGILVKASVSAPFVGECRRCLGIARGVVEAQVVELITDEPDPDTGYVIAGETLDLLAVARDACILELPLAPLCSEDCAGLCPECGTNLNSGTCSCTRPIDPRWAGLVRLGTAGTAGSATEDEPADRRE